MRMWTFRRRAQVALTFLVAPAFWACDAGTDRTPPPGEPNLDDLGTRYAAAWSGQDPHELASFYAEDGVLTVNDGAPSVGREAIAATAQAFMEAFPDMTVVMDSVVGDADHATFYWTWTGTNTGPGGTGRSVRLNGYEEWTLAAGRITESLGHYDEAEYRRQVAGE